jgi:hypothetical protein
MGIFKYMCVTDGVQGYSVHAIVMIVVSVPESRKGTDTKKKCTSLIHSVCSRVSCF